MGKRPNYWLTNVFYVRCSCARFNNQYSVVHFRSLNKFQRGYFLPEIKKISEVICCTLTQAMIDQVCYALILQLSENLPTREIQKNLIQNNSAVYAKHCQALVSCMIKARRQVHGKANQLFCIYQGRGNIGRKLMTSTICLLQMQEGRE